jgi:hypothetical protein
MKPINVIAVALLIQFFTNCSPKLVTINSNNVGDRKFYAVNDKVNNFEISNLMFWRLDSTSCSGEYELKKNLLKLCPASNTRAIQFYFSSKLSAKKKTISCASGIEPIPVLKLNFAGDTVKFEDLRFLRLYATNIAESPETMLYAVTKVNMKVGDTSFLSGPNVLSKALINYVLSKKLDKIWIDSVQLQSGTGNNIEWNVGKTLYVKFDTNSYCDEEPFDFQTLYKCAVNKEIIEIPPSNGVCGSLIFSNLGSGSLVEIRNDAGEIVYSSIIIMGHLSSKNIYLLRSESRLDIKITGDFIYKGSIINL